MYILLYAKKGRGRLKRTWTKVITKDMNFSYLLYMEYWNGGIESMPGLNLG